MSDLPKTAAEARALGETFFLTGAACRNGHLAVRYANDGKCRECVNLRTKRYYSANKDKFAEYHIENREAILSRQRSYYKHKIEYHKERSAGYRAEKREEHRERAAAWHADNKDRAKEYRQERRVEYAAHSRNRRARLTDNGGTHTAEDVARLLKIQGNKCALCKRDVKKSHEVDHIMPIALGGGNDPRNLQILCPRCNRKKNKKHPADFSRELGMLI